MFFPNLLNIKRSDLVLEIGPGAYPFWRSDCLVDKFDPADDTIDLKQYGGKKMDLKGKPLFKILDNQIPFKDMSFDYAICSHVLEHVPFHDLAKLIAELNRIAKTKYIEFPTLLYDYIYDFNVHENFMDIVEDTVVCLPKSKSSIGKMKRYTDFAMHIRKITKVGIEKIDPRLFATGMEFTGEVKLKICDNEDEFFDFIFLKYKTNIALSNPSLGFLISNRINKSLRNTFHREKPTTFFQSKKL